MYDKPWIVLELFANQPGLNLSSKAVLALKTITINKSFILSSQKVPQKSIMLPVLAIPLCDTYRSKEERDYNEPDDIICEGSKSLWEGQDFREYGSGHCKESPGSCG